MDHAVQLLDDAVDLEVALDAHAQADQHVARLQRGGQPVSRGVGDRQAQRVGVDGGVVVHVAAHGRRGDGGGVDVVVGEGDGRRRQQAHLDRARLLDQVVQLALLQVLAHGVEDGRQRRGELAARQALFGRAARRPEQREQRPVHAAHGDQADALGADVTHPGQFGDAVVARAREAPRQVVAEVRAPGAERLRGREAALAPLVDVHGHEPERCAQRLEQRGRDALGEPLALLHMACRLRQNRLCSTMKPSW